MTTKLGNILNRHYMSGSFIIIMYPYICIQIYSYLFLAYIKCVYIQFFLLKVKKTSKAAKKLQITNCVDVDIGG